MTTDPDFGAKPEAAPRKPPSPGVTMLMMFGGLAGGFGLPNKKAKWVIRRSNGTYLLYKEGSRKGRPKLFSTEGKAKRTLSRLPEAFRDSEVRKV